MLMSRTLAQVRIDPAPAPPNEALPRMDVAVFVGFASTGPTHRPVAIESVAQYAAVFGPDAVLAWDSAHGERVTPISARASARSFPMAAAAVG